MVGKLRLNEWTDRNGEKRSRIQVVADVDTPAIGAYPRKAG